MAGTDVDAIPLGRERMRLVAITRRGLGMTLAAVGYWGAMAGVSAWAGLAPAPLAVFFLLGSLAVYPLGIGLNRLFGGDLLARGSALRGLIGAITLGQFLGWPLLITLFLRNRELLAFALAAMLGVHFLPYGWLYRSPAYYALGVGSVLLAAGLQWSLPGDQAVIIPSAMALAYLLAAGAVWRENRRDLRQAPAGC